MIIACSKLPEKALKLKILQRILFRLNVPKFIITVYFIGYILLSLPFPQGKLNLHPTKPLLIISMISGGFVGN